MNKPETQATLSTIFKTIETTQKAKQMSHTYTAKQPGMNPGSRQVYDSCKTPSMLIIVKCNINYIKTND